MIEAVAKYRNDPLILYSKFSDMEMPKPQWMLDEDQEKLDRQLEERRMLRECEIVTSYSISDQSS